MGQTSAANSLNAQAWFLNAGHQIHTSGNTECTAEMSSVSSEVFHSGEFHSDGVEALVWFPKEPSSEQFLKEPFFLNAKNI